MKPERVSEVIINNLPSVAESLAKALLKAQPFVLWLHGDLGAGKTTFSREIIWALGLSKSVPVPSPTFTYLNSYKTPHGLIAHIDLYRAETITNVEEFLSLDSMEYRGFLVEWPERLVSTDLLKPTHRIVLTHVDEKTRSLDFLTE